MAELWRRASELFWKHPLLWVPALAADLLSFIAGQLQGAALHRFMVSHLEYHSALGGAIRQVPASQAMLTKYTALGIAITWTCYFGRMLLYVCGFVITAVLVRRLLSGAARSRSMRNELGTRTRGILGIGGRLLLIYGAAAFLFSFTSGELIAHGHQALMRPPWYAA